MVDLDSILEHSVVVAWSGGLDSTSLIHLLLRNFKCNVYPYFINRNQNNLKYELESIDHYTKIFSKYDGRFCPLTSVSVKIPPDEFDSYPETAKYALRNSDIINQGVRIALKNNVTTVLLATFASDYKYRDGTAEFLELKSCEAREGTGINDFQIRSPFYGASFPKTKSDVIKICAHTELDLSLTRSCYENSEKHCGICSACNSRKRAFLESGIVDNTNYAE